MQLCPRDAVCSGTVVLKTVDIDSPACLELGNNMRAQTIHASTAVHVEKLRSEMWKAALRYRDVPAFTCELVEVFSEKLILTINVAGNELLVTRVLFSAPPRAELLGIEDG